MLDQSKPRPVVVVLDFDGVIAVEDKGIYPQVGAPIPDGIALVRWLNAIGWAVVISSCREGEAARIAQEWMGKQGLYFDCWNENHPALLAEWPDCRKVTGDFIVDDKTPGFNMWSVMNGLWSEAAERGIFITCPKCNDPGVPHPSIGNRWRCPYCGETRRKGDLVCIPNA